MNFFKGFLILTPLILTSCFNRQEVLFFSGQTMGTTYSVKFIKKPENMSDLKLKVDALLSEVNRQMSTYKKDSEITMVNEGLGGFSIQISPWFLEVLKYSLDLAKKTNGSYDPTLGPLVNLWGFGPDGKRKVPSKEDIEKTKSLVGFSQISIKNNLVTKKQDGVYVDLSSSAKGFGVDKVSELLMKEGFKNHLVEIGGELKARGSKFGKAWIVAVEKPQETGRSLQTVIKLKDMSIATSGDYRNFFKEGGRKYSHTIDTATGKPVRHKLVSVSVVDESCMKADALATALMSLGEEKAKAYMNSNELAAQLVFEEESKKKGEAGKTKLGVFASPQFLALTKTQAK